jgi:hypothetical protein
MQQIGFFSNESMRAPPRPYVEGRRSVEHRDWNIALLEQRPQRSITACDKNVRRKTLTV